MWITRANAKESRSVRRKGATRGPALPTFLPSNTDQFTGKLMICLCHVKHTSLRAKVTYTFLLSPFERGTRRAGGVIVRR